jgi:hypothetical protein
MKLCGTIYQLFIDFNNFHDSIRREVLYSDLIEFRMARKLFGIIKICLNETYTTVFIGKNLSNKEMLYQRCFSTLLWNTPLGGSKRTRKG